MAKEILIAESNKMVQEEFLRIFEVTDHHLSFAESDEEVLLRGKLTKPDLIIGGKALCQTIRAERDLEKVPFIILLDIFEDLSEQERKFLKADGIISRPLNEDEILSLVGHFDNEVKGKAGEKPSSKEQPNWKSFLDREKKAESKEDIFLDESWETDEEIIELVDVIEEPEPRMSIDDFAFQPKEELVKEMSSIESWETPAIETEDLSKDFALPSKEEEEDLKEISLALEEEAKAKKGSPEEDLFEKIEIEEILQKMELLQPSIEKEVLVEKEGLKLPEIASEKTPPLPQKPERPYERPYSRLDEFEAEPAEETMPPFIYEKPSQGISKPPLSEKGPETLELQELGEEEFPEIFLEELVGELEKLKEEELTPAEKTEEIEEEMALEEEISELLGEEDIQPLQTPIEEVGPVEKVPPIHTFSPMEEMPPIEEGAQAEALAQPWETMAEGMEPPKITPEGVPLPPLRLDRNIEEVITQGVQEMMQDFINRIIPEMTTKMITLTLDRIEQMVKEVVPELAERAIREEIQRLQKGEGD